VVVGLFNYQCLSTFDVQLFFGSSGGGDDDGDDDGGGDDGGGDDGGRGDGLRLQMLADFQL
jgi:hypothetical protein